MLEILGQFLTAILGVIPRLVIIRATHRGIKFKLGKFPKELRPGLHVYWPLVTQVDLVVVARQTNTLQPQVLQTLDKKSIVACGYVVFGVGDVVLAAGERNWDYDATVNDIARSAIMDIVTTHNWSDLTGIGTKLTSACRKKLKPFGINVRKAGFTDLCECRVYRVVGGSHI